VLSGRDEHRQRGITRSTDFGPSAQNYCQNQTKPDPLAWIHRPMWRRAWRISPLVSLPPSFRVAVPLTRSQHLFSCTRNQLYVQNRPIRGAQGHGNEHRSLGFPPLSSRPNYPSTFLVRYPRSKAGNCRERSCRQPRSDPLRKRSAGEETHQVLQIPNVPVMNDFTLFVEGQTSKHVELQVERAWEGDSNPWHHQCRQRRLLRSANTRKGHMQ
jgi:hypothetical protein